MPFKTRIIRICSLLFNKRVLFDFSLPDEKKNRKKKNTKGFKTGNKCNWLNGQKRLHMRTLFTYVLVSIVGTYRAKFNNNLIDMHLLN